MPMDLKVKEPEGSKSRRYVRIHFGAVWVIAAQVIAVRPHCLRRMTRFFQPFETGIASLLAAVPGTNPSAHSFPGHAMVHSRALVLTNAAAASRLIARNQVSA